jgi:hypothetical protein
LLAALSPSDALLVTQLDRDRVADVTEAAREAVHNSASLNRLKKALKVTDPDNTLYELNKRYGNAASAVADMMLAQPTYAVWKQRGVNDNSVLWIHARAGAGLNDVLLRLIDDLQALANASKVKSIVIALFFCHDENQGSAAHLVRSLMYQLIKKLRSPAQVLLRAGYGHAQATGRGKVAGNGQSLDIQIIISLELNPSIK